MGLTDLLPTRAPTGIAGLVPTPVASFLGSGAIEAQPINEQLPSYRSQFTNKYNELSADLAQLPTPAREALINYDANRVARGQPPLTREQTLGAIQTILTGQPATPPPERKVTNLAGNFLSDLREVVKSVPRIPMAIADEARDLANIGTRISEAEDAGANPLAALLQAPGVRMIPGAYTLGNIASGGKGIKEAITHPLLTALDILPGAELAARTTKVGKLATEAAAAAGGRPHALQQFITRRMDDGGEVVPRRAAQAVTDFRDNTRLGQALESFGGARNRDVSMMMNTESQVVKGYNTGLLDPTGNIPAEVGRDARLLGEKYGINTELTADTLRRMELDNWDNATPEQLAFHAEYKEKLNGPLSQHVVSEGALDTIYNTDGTPELVTPQQAKRVRNATKLADQAERMTERHTRITSPSTRDLPTIRADVHAILDDTTLQPGEKRVELRAIFHELDAQGYDPTTLRTALNSYSKKYGDNFGLVRSTMDKFINDAPTPVTRYAVPDIINTLKKYGRHGDTPANDLAKALADNNGPRILASLRNLERRTKLIPELADDPQFAASIRSIQRRYKFVTNEIPQYTDLHATKLRDRANKARREAVPARWRPLAQHRAEQKFIELQTAKAATPQQAAAITKAILDKRYEALPDFDPITTKREIANLVRDTERTWQEMQAAGLNPTFVHHVSPQQAAQALNPSVSEVPNTISQVKERGLDASAYHQDATVAISHAANEWLRRQRGELVIDTIARKYGTKESELRQAAEPRVDALLKRTPGLSRDTAYQTVMHRTHTPFDPEKSGYNWGSPRLKALSEDRYWIPNSIANNLKAIHDPKSLVGGILDPVTKVFRTSVLALSPRNLLNNTLGGATMLMGNTGPTAFRNWRAAYNMVRNPMSMWDDPRISDAMRVAGGSQLELFRDLDKTQFTGKVRAQILDGAEFMKGRTLGRIYRQIQDAKATGQIKDKFGKVVQTSYNINSMTDDFYKILAYLYGHDKSITKGLSKEAAERAGMELMRKTQPNWISLTPIERTLMKSIFPFYGFTNHAIRYVFRYPMDHPLRASFTAKFAEAELEDLDALPGNFLGALFLGGQSDTGHQTALNLGQFNPFGDVATSLTVAGFVSATNPAIQTALESVGIRQGEAELYPTLRYDAASGRLTAQHGNILGKFLGNVIPQSQIAMALLGANGDFRETMKRDPAAAYRSMLSSGGIPLVWRDYIVPVEQAKAEVARQKSANAALAQAQKSGNWSDALRYPTLRAYYDQTRALAPEEAAKYQPRDNEVELLKQSIQPGQSVTTGPTSGI